MFNKNNFCHVASNNRNEQKAGIFVYKTTDNLQTISASGYFNEKIIDINLHDLIIHEQTDNVDRTKVKYNILAVTERTLDNVGTTVIKRDWDVAIETAIQTLQQYVDTTFVRKDGTSVMTGPLLMRATDDFKCAVAPYWDGIGFFKLNDNNSVTLMASIEYNSGFEPDTTNTYNIGASTRKWKNLYLSGKAYMSVINNGYDIAVPQTTSADTLALKSQVDLAANSGSQLYTTGVWYAKMYAGTTPPAAEDGTNYADFSQVDTDNNPIIVIYERQSGAWVEITRITPPATYNGYITVTSKIWDIAEQSGQQGGQILWSWNNKTFTPYPKIISFESINITGNSTVDMPVTPTDNNIANKKYVDTEIIKVGSGKSIDAEIAGTLTITDNSIVSGFSGGNYLKFPSELSFSNNFEIGCAFSTTDISSAVFCFYSSYVWGINIQTANSKLQVKINTQTIIGTTTLLSDTKYYVKLTSDGVNYTLSLSTDGVNYTQEATAAITDTPNTSDYTLGSASTNATLYMQDYYIKQNGILVWNGFNSSGLHQRVAKGHELIEFQKPTSNNNYTWYRKYADGWVEQGGIETGVSSNYSSVTLPVEMSDTNYTLICNTIEQFSGNNYAVSYISSVTAFEVKYTGSGTAKCCWQASGMYA